MSQNESDKSLAAYEQTFMKYDPNGYCLLSLDLLPKMLEDLGIAPNKAIMELELPKIRSDTNLISISQFIYLCQQLTNADSLREKFEKFIQRFDVNDNCQIDREELKEAMNYIGERMTEEQIDAILKEFDCDKDGAISLDDFCKAMMK